MIKSQGINVDTEEYYLKSFLGKITKWHAMWWGFSARKYKALHLRRAVPLPKEQLAAQL